MKSEDFFLALDLLEKEKRINKEQFIEFLEAGIASAYKKEIGETRNVSVQLNPDKQTIKVIAYKTIVDEVVDPEKEISVDEAKKIKSAYKAGDVISEELSTKNFTRIAAQTAKQVIMQRINDAHKNIVFEEMSQKEGEIVSCQIRRIENDNIYVEMTGTQMEGVMLKSDQIKDEKYNVGDIIKVFVKSIRTSAKGTNQVMVSRTNTGFVRRLFELEVPEIKAGLVVVKKIVREPGIRTKIAVVGSDGTIDAVGSCIGQKGMRINSIVQELNGEKIDVIQWCENPGEFIARALSPAKVIAVSLDENEQKAKAIVPDDSFLMAIGKFGVNAKLAVKLTDWKIDVKKFSETSGDISNDENKD